jgi:hypothetical protein
MDSKVKITLNELKAYIKKEFKDALSESTDGVRREDGTMWYGGRFLNKGEVSVLMASDYYGGRLSQRYYYNKTLDKFVSAFDIIHNNIDMRTDFLCSYKDIDNAKKSAIKQRNINPEPGNIKPESIELTVIGVDK